MSTPSSSTSKLKTVDNTNELDPQKIIQQLKDMAKVVSTNDTAKKIEDSKDSSVHVAIDLSSEPDEEVQSGNTPTVEAAPSTNSMQGSSETSPSNGNIEGIPGPVSLEPVNQNTQTGFHVGNDPLGFYGAAYQKVLGLPAEQPANAPVARNKPIQARKPINNSTAELNIKTSFSKSTRLSYDFNYNRFAPSTPKPKKHSTTFEEDLDEEVRGYIPFQSLIQPQTARFGPSSPQKRAEYGRATISHDAPRGSFNSPTIGDEVLGTQDYGGPGSIGKSSSMRPTDMDHSVSDDMTPSPTRNDEQRRDSTERSLANRHSQKLTPDSDRDGSLSQRLSSGFKVRGGIQGATSERPSSDVALFTPGHNQNRGVTTPSPRAVKRSFSSTDYAALESIENEPIPPIKAPRNSSTQFSPPHHDIKCVYTPATLQPLTGLSQTSSTHDTEEYEGDQEMEDINHQSSPQINRSTAHPRPMFNNPGSSLLPSRYSGIPLPTLINQTPPLVRTTSVSNATLLKRGLSRGSASKISKRGYGANDPENIAIVNMVEVEGLGFNEIAKRLNEERVRLGRNPGLSATSVTARYSRTAPLLFAARGEEFVPLSQRGNGRGRGRRKTNTTGDGNNGDGDGDDGGKGKGGGTKGRFKIDWTDELDVILVQAVKEVERSKWTDVAALFEVHTGRKLTPHAAALRHTLL